MGNFNYTSGPRQSGSYWLHDTGGELAPGQFDSTNYTVKAGFEYIGSIIPFTFSVSNSYIDLATLTPEVPATDMTIVEISSGAAFGYRVTAISNHSLKHNAYNDVFIPHAVGDNLDITRLNEGAWVQNTTYGFGYTLSNVVSNDAVFVSGYRAFADASQSESPVAILESPGVTRESSVAITYKVNISPNQNAGSYENIVTYVATGTY